MQKNQFRLYQCFVLACIVLTNITFCAAESRIQGCPTDTLVQIDHKMITKCPVCGLPLSEVREGYIADERLSTTWVDTLSKEEKKLLDRNDNSLKMIIYTSADKKASFEPCDNCKKELITMRYICNKGKYACKTKINSTCEEITSASTLQNSLAQQPEEIAEQLMQERLKAYKERMQQALGSWPIFYEQKKQAGFSEEQIITLFEDVKKQIYQQFSYDPLTQEFDESKLREIITNNPGEQEQIKGGVN
ncbi:MAG: hypothetical protein WDL87_05990 [Candidatus Omnitrophota bacterium]|jgi:hypothetical protein